MDKVQTRLTSTEFHLFRDLPENARKRFELHYGEIVEMPSPSVLHQWIVAELLFMLKAFLRENPIGYAFGDNLDYEPPDGIVVQPDVSFVSFERAPILPKEWKIMPDLAVEIMSPSNRESDMLTKVQLYFAYETRLVWVVYPDERMVRVYTPAVNGVHVRQLLEGETLDGGTVLPNFTAEVKNILPKPENT